MALTDTPPTLQNGVNRSIGSVTMQRTADLPRTRGAIDGANTSGAKRNGIPQIAKTVDAARVAIHFSGYAQSSQVRTGNPLPEQGKRGDA